MYMFQHGLRNTDVCGNDFSILRVTTSLYRQLPGQNDIVSFVFDLQLCSVQSGGTVSRCLVQCLERSSYTTHLEDQEYVWGVSNFVCYH